MIPASVTDRDYHCYDQRDHKHYPNHPTTIWPDNSFEVTRDQVTRNSADKKDQGHEPRDQPWPTRSWSSQTLGTSKDELLGDAESVTVAREKATVTSLTLSA